MKNKKLFWGLAAVCAVNFLAHLFVYPHLPETIPTHWGYNGQVDGWSPRWMDLILAGLPLLLLVFLYVIPRIDPKAENFEKHRAIWNGCQTGITLFLVAISWITELSVFGALPQKDSLVSSLICGGVGILLIGVGNYMPRIRQNYTFGCRTPGRWPMNTTGSAPSAWAASPLSWSAPPCWRRVCSPVCWASSAQWF